MLDNQPHESLPRSPCAERRRVERYPSDQEASCHPASSLESAPAQVKDVSTRGIGLVSPRRFAPGAIVVLELGETAPYPVNTLARVVRVVALPGGGWHAGCVFLSEVGEEEVAAFRAERKRSAVGDRRAGIRQPMHLVALCRPVGVGSLGNWTAEIRNLSPEGVGLVLSIPCEVGVQLRLEVPAEGEEPARTDLVRVERCEPRPDGTWFLGCRVVPSPPSAPAGSTPPAEAGK